MNKTKTKTKMTLGESIVRALELEGVKTVYGLVGSHILDPYRYFQSSSIESVTAKHEANATFMAEAHARLSGSPGVTIVTAGPGSLNGMNGLGQSQFSSTPVVHLSGAVPTNARVHELHAADDPSYTAKCAEPICKASFRPESSENVLKQLAQAFCIAKSFPQGPVHFEIPLDLFGLQEDVLFNYQVLEPDPLILDEALIDAAQSALSDSNKPVVVIDKACVRQNAHHSCVLLAESINAKIVVTRSAIGAIRSDHPSFVGVLDTFYSGDNATEVLQSSDLVIAIGFDARSYDLDLLHDRSSSRIVEIGTNIVALGVNYDGCVQIDIGRSITMLVQSLKNKRPSKAPVWKANTYEEYRLANVAQAKKHIDNSQIEFSWAMAILSEYIDKKTIVVQDVGYHEIWSRAVSPIYDRKTQIGSGTWASMGFAIPGAIAARFSDPDRRIFAITGDGCLLMSMNDLVTIAEVGGPILIIVSNDSEYSLISKVQLDRHNAVSETNIKDVDFCKVAKAMGIKSISVETRKEFLVSIKDIDELSEPYLIDIRCNTPIEMPAYKLLA